MGKKIASYEVKSMSIKELNSLRDQGLLDSSMAYQRSFKSQWLRAPYRSAVLDSIMRGFSIGTLFCVERENGILEFLDGKQRLNFISLTLDNLKGFENMQDDSLNGNFSEWPKISRDLFLDYKLSMVVFSGLDEAEKRLQFERLNAGVKLTAIERRRGSILNIVLNDSFVSSVKLVHECLPPVAGRVRSYDSAEAIILQSFSFLVNGNTSFLSSDVIDTLKNASENEISKGLKQLAINCKALNDLWAFDRSDIENRKPGLKFIMRKTFLNALLCVPAVYGKIKGYNPLSFYSWRKLRSDLEYGPDQAQFKFLCSAGSGNSQNVADRIEILTRVNKGLVHFTKNIAKPETSTPKKSTKKAVLKKSPAEIKKVISETSNDWVKMWGEKIAIPETLKIVYENVENVNGKNLKPKLKKENEDYTFSYVDTSGKNRFNNLISLGLEFD